ncbi:NIL domain-containing protein [Acetobacterium sp.]|jgi:ferredoxin|uniref:NIL domain-containing protein n=1 Tax=Acetobacterium sp. TaxID=1872094 RepID=UPI000CAD7FBB|nr:NIL domain-containing protein [Acetobacterium sp.]MDO9492525.1 NIL domain-containing protein [Acetobacterium sp.]PKM71565.1 MAG: 4Fe-4S ferredoxin [Firmicutes bacterium HGW-Firmicutes-17]
MIAKKILLSFPQKSAGQPMAMELIKTYHLDFNILKAFIDDNIKGTLLIEIKGEEADIEAGIVYLREHQIGVRDIQSVVEVDENKCVSCGACTAVCAVGALEMTVDWSLVHHDDKCLECMLCVKACPMRAIHALI